MRQRHYTLTPAAVRAHAQLLCQRHLRLADHGPKCTAGLLWAVLLYAASRLSSIAAAHGLTLSALEAANPQFGPLSRRDWKLMRAGMMDAEGRDQTERAWSDAVFAVRVNLGWFLLFVAGAVKVMLR